MTMESSDPAEVPPVSQAGRGPRSSIAQGAPAIRSSWRAVVMNETAVLEMELEAAKAQRTEMDWAVFEGIERFIREQIDISKAIAEAKPQDVPGRGNPFRFLRRFISGGTIEEAWGAVHRGKEALLLLQPAEAVVARIPELRAEVKERFRPSDARFDEYLRTLDDIQRSWEAQMQTIQMGLTRSASWICNDRPPTI